jgi:tRNA (adenine57-N1/adenine58-N1)-methyltransferase
MRILVDEHPKKGKNFYVRDLKRDFHTKYGTVRSDDIMNARPGDEVKNNRGNESFTVLDADFIDRYKCIRRGAQIMTIKDIGFIIAVTGMGKDTVVVEAGAGSGGCACMVARVAQKVYSYDISKENLEIARANAKDLELDNIEFALNDIYEDIPQKDVDVVILDVTEPWRAIESAYRALRVGGYLISYSPCITQTQEFINTIRDTKKFLIEKNIDILHRAWAVDGKKVRPVSGSISHTAFISVVRKLR